MRMSHLTLATRSLQTQNYPLWFSNRICFFHGIQDANIHIFITPGAPSSKQIKTGYSGKIIFNGFRIFPVILIMDYICIFSKLTVDYIVKSEFFRNYLCALKKLAVNVESITNDFYRSTPSVFIS